MNTDELTKLAHHLQEENERLRLENGAILTRHNYLKESIRDYINKNYDSILLEDILEFISKL